MGRLHYTCKERPVEDMVPYSSRVLHDHMTTEQSTLVLVVCSVRTCRCRGVKSRLFEVGRLRVDAICIALHAVCRYSSIPPQHLRYCVNSVVCQLLCVKLYEREYRRCWLCYGSCQLVLFVNVKFTSCAQHHGYMHLTLHFHWFCLDVKS